MRRRLYFASHRTQEADVYLAFYRSLGRRAYGVRQLLVQREHSPDVCDNTVAAPEVIRIVCFDDANGHIRYVSVYEPVTELAGTRAKRYAELADRKPEELAIE